MINLPQKWSKLDLPIKIAISISTLGMITSFAYFAYIQFAQPLTTAEINIPVTPPIPTPAINWQTPHASFQADSIEISTNTTGSSYPSTIFQAIQDNMTPLTISSDPPNGTNPDRTTLETSWKENGTNMRIYLYFDKNTDPTGQQTWKLTKITSYNGENPGEVVDSYSGAPELYTSTPIGSPLILPEVNISTSGGGIFGITIINLRLEAFIDQNPVTAKTVTLTASPPPTNLFLGQEKTLNINAHVDNDHLTAVQLDLHYDPNNLSLSNLTPTDYLPNILANPSYGSGIITATFAAPPDSGGRTDWGTVANLTITPITTGPTIIEFGPSTRASATSSNSNVLAPTSTVHITVHNLGDINVDGIVDIFDYNAFISEYGKTGYSPADFNQDNIIDIFDYNIFITNYGLTESPISYSSDSDCPDNHSCRSTPHAPMCYENS